MDLREPSPPPGLSGDNPMGLQFLLQLALDPDPKITGRPFRGVQSSIKLATIASHVDQATLVEVIKVRKQV